MISGLIVLQSYYRKYYHCDLFRRRCQQKPSKPYPDFPLSPHASGKWQKKIRGRIYYFGRWDDWEGALEEYQAKRDYLYAGKEPPGNGPSLDLKTACNNFYESRLQRLRSGQLTQRSVNDYRKTCELLLGFYGKTRAVEAFTPSDFRKLQASLNEKWGPVTVGNSIRRIRCLFTWLYDSELIDKPVRFGVDFKPPSKSVIRKIRNAAPPREFSAEELRLLIDRAGTHMQAMIYLAINGGLGQMDLSCLEFRHVDLVKGVIVFPRTKTAVQREFPLWQETSSALQESISLRKTPDPQYASLVFITAHGNPWVRDTPEGSRTDSILQEFTKLKKLCGITGRNKGFYSIRHAFRTVADETLDHPAVNHIMGHADGTMADAYRERIDTKRLKAVTEYVRKWLFRGV